MTDDRWLSSGVVSVGAASFFSDAGHEIATSVLPSFLTSTLHAGPGAGTVSDRWQGGARHPAITRPCR